MQDPDETIAALGNEPPLIADGRGGPPDRRDVSARWLSGTFLTGITSTVLMGVALFAALDGQEEIAALPSVARVEPAAPSNDGSGEEAKTARLANPKPVTRARDRKRMEVSTVTRVGDREVVRMTPFLEVKMALATPHPTTRSYPAFDPLAVFADNDDDDAPSSDPAASAPVVAASQIYDTSSSARVEGEVGLKTVDFPLATAAFDEKSQLSPDEVEQVVRNTAPILSDGQVEVAALHYVDPQRFGQSTDIASAGSLAASFAIRFVPENVSVARPLVGIGLAPSFGEAIVQLERERPIAEALADAGYDGEEVEAFADRLGEALGAEALEQGAVLRLGTLKEGDTARLVRLSAYRRAGHVATIVETDRGRLVVADHEPEQIPEIAAIFDDSPAPQPVRARGDLPTIYDGIYRAAYSYGLSKAMTGRLVRLLAADVDFQSRLGPQDSIDLFFTQPNDDDTPSDESELLYVNANIGGAARKLYRFRMEDGSFDYFDDSGRSSRQFLLRNPVPNGQFRSGFGARRHPILGYVKMHTGVDWAAPRGTPIIASGSGVVEKAGWAGGYGRQTIIRHANGYETSYNHQSGIAKGVKPGARIRQGQVIGYVGSTGLATGDHLHYELIVNGRKVDPMRVRLPGGRALKGKELEAFHRERERIDKLLLEQNSPSLKVAVAEPKSNR